MMDSTPEMSSSLLGDDGGSQKSGRSLLERIQMQRQREQAMPQQVVQVPQQQELSYNAGSSGTFQTPWSNPFGSDGTTQNDGVLPNGGGMMGGFGGSSSGGMGESLLGGGSNLEEYSMGNYFMTFVRDIYELFMRLHVVARVIVVCGLLYVVYRLL